MLNTVRQFFTPPVFPDDDDKTRAVRVLYVLLAGMLAITALDAMAVLFVAVRKTEALIALAILLAVTLVSAALAQRGRVRFASAWFVFGLWLIFTFIILLSGRMTTAFVTIYLAVTRRLRADPDGRLAAVPIIALTALAMPGDRERCLEAGATDYLTKPVQLSQLLQLIQQRLGRAASH